jgi:conjugal transfer mating pair stabilization protein TraN
MHKLSLILCLLSWTANSWAGECQKISSVCVEGPETRTINGVAVQKDCWRFEDIYNCKAEGMIDECAPLVAQGCAQVASSCVETLDNSSCGTFEQTYQCQDQPETTKQETVCSEALCKDGNCFDTTAPSDPDMAHAVTGLEIARQAASYFDPDKQQYFVGFDNRCTKKVIGGASIMNCCSTEPGNMFTNFVVLGAGVATNGQAIGSKYVYDALFAKDDPGLMEVGVAAAALGMGGTWHGNGFALNSFGFTFDFTMANGVELVGFDPMTFSISVGLILISQWLSCEEEEQLLAMKKGEGLCVQTSSWCSNKTLLGICLERTYAHCCFNSKIAKIINVEGKAQLGIPMANGRTPNCRGFTQEELNKLDFSAMDFSDFMKDVIPKDINKTEVQNRVQSNVNNYYGQ